MQPGESLVSPNHAVATPGYFEAMRIPLIEGRFFEERDGDDSPRVVIIDERLARRFWPNRSPVGQRMWRPKNAAALAHPDASNTEWFDVVGVVGSVKLRALVDADERVGACYFPYAQAPDSYLSRWFERAPTPCRSRGRSGRRSPPSTRTFRSTTSARWTSASKAP